MLSIFFNSIISIIYEVIQELAYIPIPNYNNNKRKVRKLYYEVNKWDQLNLKDVL